MIESLTPEQEAKLPIYREKWSKIGLDTNTMNPGNLRGAVDKLYQCADLEPPENIIMCQSPVHAAVAAACMIIFLDNKEEIEAYCAKPDIQMPRGYTKVNVDHVRGMQTVLSHHLGEVQDARVYALCQKYVDLIKEKARAEFSGFICGQHDASWLSFYDYFDQETDVTGCEKIQGLVALAQEANWALTYEEYIFISDRPDICKLDDEKQLHSELGPAVRYRDGFGIYAWHGTKIPEEWFTDKMPTAAEILRIEDMEVRRCAGEMIGWIAILDELGSKEIDRHDNPQIGTLVEVDMPDSGLERYIRVRCDTGRDYAICVTEANPQTAQEAQNWLNDCPSGYDYAPQRRT